MERDAQRICLKWTISAIPTVLAIFKKIWCRNYVARTRLSGKLLSSVKKIKCRASENKPNFLEIQCGREKSNLWDGGYQLNDGGKGKKKR